jgi:hypothetical protein
LRGFSPIVCETFHIGCSLISYLCILFNLCVAVSEDVAIRVWPLVA